MALQDPTQDSDLDTSRHDPIESGIALATAIQSTLGPNGMDKMLVGSDGRVVVTNDGASILDRLEITDPVGRLLEETLQSQKRAVQDGTTTTLVLIGELLSTARSLQDDGFHPTTIIQGYQQATIQARAALSRHARPTGGTDDPLRKVAKTAVTGRWDEQSSERFASLSVSALQAIAFDTDRLTISAYPGSELGDSELIDGLLVDLDSSSTSIDLFDGRELQRITEPRIALVGSQLTVDTPDCFEAVSITDPQQATGFRSYETEVRDTIVHRLADVGADVVVCQQSIDAEIRSALAGRGILPIERTRQDEFDRLTRATGATAVQSVQELDRSAVGAADSVHRRAIGPTDVLTVSGGPGPAHASLLLRGGTPHVAAETERISRTCTAVVRRARDDGEVVPGGGATQLAVARELSAYAPSVADRTQIVVEAFADALRQIPRVLATNAGADPIDTLAVLESSHDAGMSATGISRSGSPANMVDQGVVAPRTVLDHCLVTAFEAVASLLRIDAVHSASTAATDPQHSEPHDGHDHDSHPGGGYPWALSH